MCNNLLLKKLASILCALGFVAFLGEPILADDGTRCQSESQQSCSSQGAISGGFGSPDSVGKQLEEDARTHPSLFQSRSLEAYFAAKKQLADDTGFNYGVDYSSVVLSATNSPDPHYASGGVFRFFGSWDLVNAGEPNSGALVWKVEHRHGYSELAPKALGVEVGYAGLFEVTFSDEDWRLTNLYWRQRFLDDRATITAGFLDTSDYVDAFAMGSPWQHFMNFAFSTGSATVGLPNDATLGIAGGMMLTDNIYAIASIADANAVATDPFNGFNTAFENGDYFTSLEFGWTSSKQRLIFDNVHATLWHTDGSAVLGVANGWGAAFSATTYIDDKWLVFLRGGYAEGGGTLLGKSISTGFGYQPVTGGNLLGVAINWGAPNETTFAPNLSDQWTAEAFYRVQITENFAVTPDIQVIFNPALNPTEDTIGIIGLRARLAL